MKSFTQLKKNLKKDFSALRKLRVALLGDTATQFLNQALKGAGFDNDVDIIVWEADFNQIERQVLDLSSDLYRQESEVIIIFQSSHKLLAAYNKLKIHEYINFADRQLSLINDLFTAVNQNTRAKIIFYNFAEIDDAVFGNYANKVEASFLFQLRKINFHLSVYALSQPNFYVCDISAIQNLIGKAAMFQPSVYINTDMVLNIDVLPFIAFRTIDIIASFNGQFKKCLILDLDNTLWGGVIGDDGLDKIQIGSLGIGKAFTEFQYWLKKLKNRGIILTVCSKNNDSIAREPFEKHPDMVLHLDDIAVFLANWENKVDNIRFIQQVLNIGFDSMVFLDDNPFERNIVRENIVGITVPELPSDPADYLEYLYALNLFETSSFSTEDQHRTRQYQVQAQRSSLQTSFTNEDDFLKNLQMRSEVMPFSSFTVPRVAQLSQRSNQFNLRTIRYTEADIDMLLKNPAYHTFSFTLSDLYGDNGLIALVILRQENNLTIFIENWLMSCRVLKRGMEQFILNFIASFAIEMGFTFLKGEYLPTLKNEMVKQHYKNLGFDSSDGKWILNLRTYLPKSCFIKINKR